MNQKHTTGLAGISQDLLNNGEDTRGFHTSSLGFNKYSLMTFSPVKSSGFIDIPSWRPAWAHNRTKNPNELKYPICRFLTRKFEVGAALSESLGTKTGHGSGWEKGPGTPVIFCPRRSEGSTL